MPARTTARSFKEARNRAGLTMEAIAEKTGLSRQAVSLWESGANAPSGAARILLSQIFGVDVAVVEGWFCARKAA